MKFARYLQDTQIPEWKKAYIDYRGLKIQLGIIRALAPQQVEASSSIATTDAGDTQEPGLSDEERIDDEPNASNLNQGDTTSNDAMSSNSHVASSTTKQKARPSLMLTLASLPPRVIGTVSGAPSQQTPLPPRTPRSPPVFPFFRESGSPTPPPLRLILANLPASHTKFFEIIDAELEKVETFYAEREKEMLERAKRLKEQLNELGVHRQMCHGSSSHSKAQNWTKSVSSALSSVIQLLQGSAKREVPSTVSASGIMASESGRGGIVRDVIDISPLGSLAAESKRQSGDQFRFQRKDKDGITQSEFEKEPESSSKRNSQYSRNALDGSARRQSKRASSLGNSLPTKRLSLGTTRNTLDPNEYRHAKRRLRKAAIEHYRGLEVLNNYRILNLTGFRKALKKYEKITSNTVLDAYMKEKVEPSAFASGTTVSTMLKEMEDLFAMRFERGDRKKAIDRLRVGPSSKTHHFSTFRSGVWLGLALPAIAGGTFLSFQEYTRETLASWNILLFIYSVFLLPVLLALLIGVNIAVWARERINYVFIFELSPRSRLDHHEYFELPSIFFCTLAYAFWFSLAQIGPPMLWPLIWLVLTLVIMFMPIRSFMWGPARWWIIKNIAKLGASGVWRVEFTDFWLGDQFCSMVYSLSNLYFVGCLYSRYITFLPTTTVSAPTVSALPLNVTSSTNITSLYRLSAESAFQHMLLSAYDPDIQGAWSTCGASHNWGWYYVFGVSPLMVRFVQSMRRYWDSKLPTHLINAGKYGMGMIYYFFYYYWKHQVSPHRGASYALWLFTATVYAIYACAWDFLMDWSMCKPHARYPLLRKELVYKSQIASYYFAMISNLCIRLIWTTYIPTEGPDAALRTFIAAMLEMLRRVQWNFYRLENEHLGNMDQYRVTREVPLPYNFDVSNEEEENEEEEEEEGHQRWSRLKNRLTWPRRNGGHG